jgi:hypothetical protein
VGNDKAFTPLQLSKCRRLEIGQSGVGCGTVKRHKCRVPLPRAFWDNFSLAQERLGWVMFVSSRRRFNRSGSSSDERQ